MCDQLLRDYEPLVRQVVARFRRTGESYEDLLQVARTALYKAMTRFDPARGVEFVSYARPTVNGELKRHLRDTGWVVRPPRSLHDAGLAMLRAEETLAQRLGRNPTIEETAAHLDIDVAQAREADRVLRAGRRGAPPDELSETDPDDESESLDEIDNIPIPDDWVDVVIDYLDIGGHVDELTPRQRATLHLRHAGYTQHEIGTVVGVSQMEISRELRRIRDHLLPYLEPA